ncbi:hypothetical protein J437_LFUL016454 [Ladona fulva]|uniref:Uncharacterized protein n=1 Tax=Ladona fulva TaxID=123851 RepID=A0A8K0KL51_LADFU|nr:hypothetical protein J437_LFUL016454 [Ladona fulva]
MDMFKPYRWLAVDESMSYPKKKPMSHLEFHSRLASDLIGKYASRKQVGPRPAVYGKTKKCTTGKSTSVSNSIQLFNVGEHLRTKGTKQLEGREGIAYPLQQEPNKENLKNALLSHVTLVKKFLRRTLNAIK